jgi:prepilin-type N-terminal cleavage/methylation domain-containing protein
MQLKFISPRPSARPAPSNRGFTLTEVVVALGISALLFAGLILGFTQSAQRAEWSAYNLAAQNLAQQGVEQARAANWDPLAPAPIDNCTQTNFPPIGTNILDVPVAGTAVYPIKMIRVDCTWRFVKSGVKSQVFTNTAATLRAPNQ